MSMAFDEGLAERIRRMLADRGDVSEKKMFGGIAFMIRGHMSVGIVKDDLMVRVGPDAQEQLVRQPHARPMDFTGRPMKGFLYVDSSGLDTDEDLQRWVGHGLEYVASLPAKSAFDGRASARRAVPRTGARRSSRPRAGR
jgi:TfoX/Sxy family transcriptional regulator of competence genes